MSDQTQCFSESRINLYKKALISTGNNHRIKKAIKKSLAGEEVTIVYLGASITMKRSEHNDKGYATLSSNYYRDTYSQPDKYRYINAGVNGTSSTIGLIRVERDVLDYRPDIVFVEFAVNDSKDSVNREVFESLIIRLLQSDNKPAVVLLFMSSETGYSCQGHMQVIGEYYHLPMISICDAVLSEVEAKRMSWREYSDDNIHPNEGGNRLITECISYFYKSIDALPEQVDISYPDKPFFGNSFVSMKLLDASNMKPLSLGGFKQEELCGNFKNGWVYHKSKGNKGFRFKLNCKALFVINKENNDKVEGSAQVYVDGQSKCVLSGYRIFGWGNPISSLVFSEEKSEEHLIEIKMMPGDEGKSFTLMAFGYCD